MPQRLKILCLALLLWIAHPSFAQTPDTSKWFWAWLADQQQLVAYNADGTVNVLLHNVSPFKLKRLDNQTAIVMGKVGDQYNVYVIDATSASLVTTLYDETYAAGLSPNQQLNSMNGPPGIDAALLQGNQVLIWNGDFDKALIFDRSTQQTLALDLGNWSDLKVSENRRYIRYRVVDAALDRLTSRWTLDEYDAVTHTTRTTFSRYKTYPTADLTADESCTPDRYGARWYCVTTFGRYEDGQPAYTAEIITVDGHEQPIEPERYLKITPNGDWYLIAADTYYTFCTTDCSIRLLTTEGALLKIFTVPDTLPQGGKPNLVYSEVLDENHLIINDQFRNGTLYILSSDDQLTYLGTVPCAPCTPASTDGRWRILYDLRDKNAPKTVVWDLLGQKIVMTRDGFYDSHGYADGGIFLSGEDFYSNADAREYQLPVSVYPYLIDMLPNGVFIYAKTNEFDNTVATGIYRYSVAIGNQLLVKDGEEIPYSSTLVTRQGV